MALEMFRNRFGREVLIAKEPVTGGSFAEVITYRTRVTLTHPPGLIVNQWPALVPEVTMLSESVQASMSKRRAAKERHLLEVYQHVTGQEAGTERLRSIRWQVGRPAICVDVGIGRPLIIKMPPGIRGEYDLGTIREIIIHNTGQDPVHVR